jgi:hypothetical protein
VAAANRGAFGPVPLAWTGGSASHFARDAALANKLDSTTAAGNDAPSSVVGAATAATIAFSGVRRHQCSVAADFTVIHSAAGAGGHSVLHHKSQ